MTFVWVVPFTDVGGAERFVRAAPDSNNIIRASFRDENGQLVALLNIPDVSPPTGRVRFVDENGQAWGVPFELIEIVGPWQRAFRAVESVGLLVARSGVGFKTKAQNGAPLSDADFGPDKSWCEFGVDFEGCEQLDFGERNTYRIVGTAAFTVNWPILRGEADLLTKIGAIEQFLSYSVIGEAMFGTAYHIPWQRGVSNWTVSVRCPFRFDFDEAPPAAGPFVDGTDVTAEAIHNAVRTLYRNAIAGETMPTLYDNAQQPTPAADKWAIFNVLTGGSAAMDAGLINRARSVGVGQALVLARWGDGLAEAWRMVDVITAAFRASTFGGVDFQVPVARSVGRVDNWWAIQVDCPFSADLVRESYV